MTMNRLPTVSIIMCVYNTERYLAQAIESIFGQTFNDFEFIIDDGSTDQSLKILKKYAAKNSRICLRSRENRGISETRNELLACAKGEFIERRQLEQQALKKVVCQRAWQRRGIQGAFTETKPWRPVDKLSLHEQLLNYGWRFFMARQRKAAIAYGIKAIRTLPLQTAGWRLLIVALVRPLPQAGAHE